MAVKLTGQNIKDTYQQLIHSPEGSLVYDGTGSLLPLKFEGNNVKISGSLIANEYVVSSSVTNISIATLSGSTTFGDSSDDTHTFTGNITASGDISASGNIHGRDRHLKDLSSLVWDSGADNQTVFALAANHNLQIYSGSTKTVNIDASAGHITASGNISASGDLIASSSLTLGAPLSKIIGPGGNDFMALGVDNIDIFINGGEVINIDNDSINLNSSAQAINTTITSDDATHLVMADATNNAVRLNNSIIMSPGAPTDYTNRLLISGSTHFTGSNSHITASGNISSSGTIIADSLNIKGNTVLGDNNGGDIIAISGSIQLTGSNGIKILSDLPGGDSSVPVGIYAGSSNNLGFHGDGSSKMFNMNAIHTNVGIVFDASSNNEGVLLKTSGGNPESINFRVGTGKSIIAENSLFVSGSEHHITASGNISSSREIIAASGSFEMIHGGTF